MKPRDNNRLPQRAVLFSICVCVAGLAVAFLGVSLWIGCEARGAAKKAMQQYDGDAVAALMQSVEDEGRTLQERNRAVWALGQLGDPRALAVIMNHSRSGPCDHAHALCQREINKARKLLEGQMNVAALVWR